MAKECSFVFQKKVAAACLLNNCVLLGVKKDAKNPSRVVFVFEKHDKVAETVRKYAKNKEQIESIISTFV